MPLRVSSTCAHHQEVKTVLYSLWYLHTYKVAVPATYRFEDTRGCIIQFWPPDDEHMCSKHLEAWNKLIVKQILCIKLVNYKDKYPIIFSHYFFLQYCKFYVRNAWTARKIRRMYVLSFSICLWKLVFHIRDHKNVPIEHAIVEDTLTFTLNLILNFFYPV